MGLLRRCRLPRLIHGAAAAAAPPVSKGATAAADLAGEHDRGDAANVATDRYAAAASSAADRRAAVLAAGRRAAD